MVAFVEKTVVASISAFNICVFFGGNVEYSVTN